MRVQTVGNISHGVVQQRGAHQAVQDRRKPHAIAAASALPRLEEQEDREGEPSQEPMRMQVTELLHERSYQEFKMRLSLLCHV